MKRFIISAVVAIISAFTAYSQDNYDVISDIMGLESNQCNETIGNIIGKYQMYKEKREKYTLKR